MKLLIVIFLLNSFVPLYALSNCRVYELVYPNIPSSGDWINKNIFNESKEKFSNCPLSIMLNEWFVYHLDNMNNKECKYKNSETVKAVCEK